jgi:hypothetical protein
VEDRHPASEQHCGFPHQYGRTFGHFLDKPGLVFAGG